MSTIFTKVKADYNKHKNQWRWKYTAPSTLVEISPNGKRKYKDNRKFVRMDLAEVQQWNKTYDEVNKMDIKLTKQQKKENDLIVKRIKIREVQLGVDLSNGVLLIDQTKKVLEFVADWLYDYAETKNNKNTINMYKRIADLIRDNGNPRFAEVDHLWVNSFHKAQQKRVKNGEIVQGTARAYYEKLKFAMYEAEREEKLDGVQVMYNKVTKVEKGTSKVGEYFTMDELKLLDETEWKQPSLKRMFLFMCWTGLRLTEAYTLTWGDVKDADGRMVLNIQERKNKVGEVIVLNEQAVSYMGKRGAKNDKVFLGAPKHHVNESLTMWANLAGIDRYVKSHDGRRTCAYLIWTRTKKLNYVQHYLSHENIITTERYMKKHFGRLILEADVEDLFPSF